MRNILFIHVIPPKHSQELQTYEADRQQTLQHFNDMPSLRHPSWLIPENLATAARLKWDGGSDCDSAIDVDLRNQQHQTAFMGAQSTRSRFYSNFNLILPRPKLPAMHPKQNAYRLLSATQRDYRSPVSSYEGLDEDEPLRIGDLRDMLEASGAFNKEQRVRSWKDCAYGEFAFGVRTQIQTADMVHMSTRGIVCQKLQVSPEDEGKLFLCHRESCDVCSPAISSPQKTLPPKPRCRRHRSHARSALRREITRLGTQV